MARKAVGGDELVYSVAQTACVGRDDAEVARRAGAIADITGPMGEGGLAGSPSQVVDQLGHFAELGASRAYLQVLDLADLDHLELIASAVAPQVAAL
jgi:alkanesulfonate monooxygenase SsuD/methylene tetrahydromethanopterin reductase-like flavin-dependent oxidoreductase (luciferase family)